jgi:hypothetical protein
MTVDRDTKFYLRANSANAIAVCDDGKEVSHVRTFGCIGDKAAMEALERMCGPIVFMLTGANMA